MRPAPSVIISSVAKAVPPLVLSNDDMVRWHQRKDAAWFSDRFGIDARRCCYDYPAGRPTSVDQLQLLTTASQEALERAGVGIGDVDALFVATCSPSHLLTDEACLLHERLGAPASTFACSVYSGCFGTLLTMKLAADAIRSGRCRRVLATSALVASSIFWPCDREAVWLPASIFGDGAASLVLEASDEPGVGLSSFWVGTKPADDVMFRRIGGSNEPLSRANADDYFRTGPEFQFQKVRANLTRELSASLSQVVRQDELDRADVDWVLFNNSNGQVQREWLTAEGFEARQSVLNIDRYGNCGAASLGIALADFWYERAPAAGDHAVFLSVGTGLQFGGVGYQFTNR